MTALQKNIQRLQEVLPELKSKYGVKSLGIFGSVRHNNHTDESDIDIVVDFLEPIGFFAFSDLECDLERVLQRPIDLVSKKALKKRIRSSILSETVYV